MVKWALCQDYSFGFTVFFLRSNHCSGFGQPASFVWLLAKAAVFLSVSFVAFLGSFLEADNRVAVQRKYTY